MVAIKAKDGEARIKIVYYGPGKSGKTTNLQKICEIANTQGRRNIQLKSIATEDDRTLFFDFAPVALPSTIRLANGLKIVVDLFTVPGQPKYKETRKNVLRLVDGVVFVADSQMGKYQENADSLDDLELNLFEHRKDIQKMPLVMQWNKQDLADIVPEKQMNQGLNSTLRVPHQKATALHGEGVMKTLHLCIKEVVEKANQKLEKFRSGLFPANLDLGEMSFEKMDFSTAYQKAQAEKKILCFDFKLNTWLVDMSFLGSDRLCFHPAHDPAQIKKIFEERFNKFDDQTKRIYYPQLEKIK